MSQEFFPRKELPLARLQLAVEQLVLTRRYTLRLLDSL
jgi:hypothetical protein